VYSAWLLLCQATEGLFYVPRGRARLFTKLVAYFLCGVGEHGEVGTFAVLRLPLDWTSSGMT
jgi:hypothetical protein